MLCGEKRTDLFAYRCSDLRGYLKVTVTPPIRIQRKHLDNVYMHLEMKGKIGTCPVCVTVSTFGPSWTIFETENERQKLCFRGNLNSPLMDVAILDVSIQSKKIPERQHIRLLNETQEKQITTKTPLLFNSS